MQHKSSPVVCLAAVGLAFAIATCSIWAQNYPAEGGFGPHARPAHDPQGHDYGTVPPPPLRPPAVQRPTGWPGHQPAASAYSTQCPQTLHPAPARPPQSVPVTPVSATAGMEPIKGTEIVGRVGPEVILAVEVSSGMDDLIQQNKDRMPPEELQRQVRMLMRQRLKNHIETKLIFLDAKQSIPEENFPNVEKSLGDHFEESELEKLLKRAKVQTRRELDQKFRQIGSSIEREKRAFMQRTLAQQWMRQKVKHDEEVTYDQMLDYYYEHMDDFRHPARARWEELVVSFSKHPDKAAARAAISWMGNQVQDGIPLAAVAKEHSDGATAAGGGRRDWTTKGSLVSEAVDGALFGLPLGQLSPILESKRGYHIVRVTQREPAYCTPFLKAQAEIEPKIRQRRTRKLMQEYLADLQERYPIWTIFDEPSAAQQTAGRGRPPRQ